MVIKNTFQNTVTVLIFFVVTRLIKTKFLNLIGSWHALFFAELECAAKVSNNKLPNNKVCVLITIEKSA